MLRSIIIHSADEIANDIVELLCGATIVQSAERR